MLSMIACCELWLFTCFVCERVVGKTKKFGATGGNTSYHTANGSGIHACGVISSGYVDYSSSKRQSSRHGIAPCLCV